LLSTHGKSSLFQRWAGRGATLYLRTQCGTGDRPWSETQLTLPDRTQFCNFRTSTITFASHKAAKTNSKQIASAKAFIVIRW